MPLVRIDFMILRSRCGPMPKSTVNASKQTLCLARFHTRLRPLRLVGLTVAKWACFTNSSKKLLSRTSSPQMAHREFCHRHDVLDAFLLAVARGTG